MICAGQGKAGARCAPLRVVKAKTLLDVIAGLARNDGEREVLVITAYCALAEANAAAIHRIQTLAIVLFLFGGRNIVS